VYNGDKDMSCGKCGKKTRWVRCPNCNGRGPTRFTTCKLKCREGYKCPNGKSDAHHN